MNTNGFIVAKYEYDPFGNIISLSGPLADANSCRFSSKELHGNSGFYYFGYRYYGPATQRWLNPDPLVENGGINLYAFNHNCPIYSIDPLGLNSCSEWASIIGAGVSGALDGMKNWVNAPVSESLGAGLGLAGLAGGGTLSSDHNAVQIENNPFMHGDITLGHFINYDPTMGPNRPDREKLPFNIAYGQHEEQHTYQYEALGDWFIPMYLAMMGYGQATGGNWWDDNYLEAGPSSCPPEPFP